MERKMASAGNSKKPFTVFVEGNIGSGKTTFLDYFNKSEDITAYAEPVNKWRDIQGHNLLVSKMSIAQYVFTNQLHNITKKYIR